MSSVREIVLDTETTGLYARSGDKVIEIGCVELRNKVRTGSTFHAYINPQRDVPLESFHIHGISAEFLQDKPIFSKIAKDFLKYIGNSTLIIHNAGFDVAFLNYELATLGYPEILISRVIDTLLMARRKHPGSPASLDALCKKYNINLESRIKHGALVDAELLALVYIALTGGSQSRLDLIGEESAQVDLIAQATRIARDPRAFALSQEDKDNHKLFLKKIKNPLWETEGA